MMIIKIIINVLAEIFSKIQNKKERREKKERERLLVVVVKRKNT